MSSSEGRYSSDPSSSERSLTVYKIRFIVRFSKKQVIRKKVSVRFVICSLFVLQRYAYHKMNIKVLYFYIVECFSKSKTDEYIINVIIIHVDTKLVLFLIF
jgi:hypothetical protein